MWKKDEEQSTQPTTQRPSTERSRTGGSGGGRATIGPSISIEGDVTGSEDLLIEGEVRGSVHLDEHAVAVGGKGRVNADIEGRVITVEGRVEGNLTAQEQIVLRGSAHVQGDITAPRVVLEDGANFRGLVDMGPSSKPTTSTESRPERKSAEPTDRGPKPKVEHGGGSAGPSSGKAEKGGSPSPRKATA